MRTFILYLTDGEKYELKKLTDVLSSIDGTSHINGENFTSAIVGCEFAYNDDLATLRLEGELDALAIEGISEAGFELVWEIAKRLNHNIRITDGDYSFDFSLGKPKTKEEFQQMVFQHFYDDFAESKISDNKQNTISV